MNRAHVLIAATLLGCPRAAVLPAAPPRTDEPITLVSAEELAFGPGAVARFDLWGIADAGPFARAVKLRAGEGGVWHWHTQDKQGVVIAGRLSHYPVGTTPEQAKVIGPGGFFNVPGGLVHATWCYAGEDCQLVMTMRGPFDFVNVKLDGGSDGGRSRP